MKQAEQLERAHKLFLKAEQHESGGRVHDAFSCLREAAALGHSSSQLNLGNFYSSGTGVRKNKVQAAQWYKAAYRNGNVTGARNLGIDRLNAGDYRGGIYWLNKAIARDDGGSFVILATHYAKRSSGVKKAIALLRKLQKLGPDDATELDHENASNLLGELGRKAEKIAS
jgi:TPR repeat protein